MDWISEDGQHCGFVVPEFADGVRGSAAGSDDVPDGQILLATDGNAQRDAGSATAHVTRPAGEVIGWRVMCDCRSAGSPPDVEVWSSSLLVRVPSKALEDPSAGRLFVWRDEDVTEVEQIHPSLYQLWRHSHVDRLDVLRQVHQRHLALAEARKELDRAVRRAHELGHSWGAIGQVVGMSRQSAHERWRPL